MSKINRIVLFVFALTVILAGTARAEGGPITKLGRGLENIVTSPVEFLTQFIVAGDENGPVTTFVKGTVYGTGAMVGRILGGATEVVTFPIPLPRHYDPLMDPKTPLKALSQVNN